MKTVCSAVMSKGARWIAAVAALGCQPQPLAPRAIPVSHPEPPAEHADDCRRDIPDCSAACALRETNHLEFIDWYDRRCAAVILGKNPDKTAGVEPPVPPKSCDPPFTLDAQGVKIWKRDCL